MLPKSNSSNSILEATLGQLTEESGIRSKHLTLREYIGSFETLPERVLKHYQVKPMLLEAKELIDNYTDFYLGRAAWLKHKLFNYNFEPPSILTQTHWSQYELFASMSLAMLELSRATRSKSPRLQRFALSSEHLWFLWETSNFLYLVKETGLGRYLQIPELSIVEIKAQGKDDLHTEYLAQSDFRKFPGLPVESVAFSRLPSPCTEIESVVITEAQKLARSDSDFKDLHWNSYWKTSDQLFNQVRHSEDFQVVYLLKTGLHWKLYRGRKGKKLPNVESKEFTKRRGRGRPPKSNKSKL